MNPLVSVIIPVYNRRQALISAVESVLMQTCSNWELVVVDDGSDDSTDISRPVSCPEFKYIPVILNSNRGVSAARNIGVSMANGEWIAFLDSDDVWHKTKLEKQLAWLEKNPSYSIVQTREVWIRNGVRVNPPATHIKHGGDIFLESLKRCMITPSSVMLKKSLFAEIGGFNESLPACEDYDLWLRITCRYPVGLVEEDLLTRYGGNPDQLSSRIFALDRFRIRSLLDLVSRAPLSECQRETAIKTLVEKAGILAGGFEKHKKADLSETYREIAAKFKKF